ncbi:helix-turn-helix domain-containing protein [Paenibacillus paridis]|uniref:helix-turn-helix domain-containing protein n=1 Tax=Paenibacillus paridis TaxID=2583376 RepID=UPI00111D787A|nr:helix-turn-helix domain-containing protein [Paenibacillus paridis]
MELTRFCEPDLHYHVYVKDALHFQKTHDTYDHWALFIVEDGSFDYRMGGQSGRAVKDDMVLCPPDLTFYRKTSLLSFHLLGFQWLSDSDTSFTSSHAADFPPTRKLRLMNNRRFHSILSQLREARYLNPALGREYKKHLLKDLLYLLQIELSGQQTTPLFSEDPLLQQAVHRLQQQAEFGLSLKTIAAELGLSQVQLTRLFKQEFRMAPSTYAATLRMDKVKQLLVHSSLTLSQIAEHCGFTDEHHLSKSFKKMFGINPSAYRKTYRV